MRPIDADDLKKSLDNYVFNDPTCPMHIAATVDQYIDFAPTVCDWIPCSERMPKAYVNVILYGERIGTVIGMYSSYNEIYIVDTGNRGIGKKAITHWMPLPEPPGGDEE